MQDKIKILVVDDKPENLFAIAKVLEGLDVELINASSGNEALSKTLHHNFALALLDIQMPGMDGYELASILREDEKTSELPFIFISAIYTDHINIFKGYEKGAFSFITKPFQPEILINKVKFFIDKYEQGVALKKAKADLENKVKERTTELEVAMEELAHSNKELANFAYVASHDLQEPLRVITSYLQLLERKYENELDSTANKYIKTTVEATNRMKQLITDLLAFSKVGASKIVKEKINVDQLLKSVIEDLGIAIKENDAKIITEKYPEISGDPMQIRQLFQNLIGNSIKFKKQDERPIIEIKSKEYENYIQFAIKDNGIGIEEEYFERIFVIFQRLHTRAQYSGTGIGLSICKKIVEQHGGTIRIKSKPQEGTEICFNLPKK